MKRAGITQRVEIIQKYEERRDCLDRRWISLFSELGWLVIPLPNIASDYAEKLLNELKLDAYVLSGGNSLDLPESSTNDVAPERDSFEKQLLESAMIHTIPVLGVCRGMQMLNVHFGGSLTPVENHAGTRHKLSALSDNFRLPTSVNSYHKWGIQDRVLAEGLIPIAQDSDGNIEAFEHTDYRMFGIMWHPEREEPFCPLDIELIKKVL